MVNQIVGQSSTLEKGPLTDAMFRSDTQFARCPLFCLRRFIYKSKTSNLAELKGAFSLYDKGVSRAGPVVVLTQNPQTAMAELRLLNSQASCILWIKIRATQT
jgi:hypothetical protein